MKLQSALCILLLLPSAVRAGTFSTTAWTGDSNTGIAAGQTNWAYHFGDTVPVTINGVNVPGLAGPAVSHAHFGLTFTGSGNTSIVILPPISPGRGFFRVQPAP